MRNGLELVGGSALYRCPSRFQEVEGAEPRRLINQNCLWRVPYQVDPGGP